MGEWSIVKSKELGVPYIDTADMKLYLAAPLVSELGEWLPETIQKEFEFGGKVKKRDWHLSFTKTMTEYTYSYYAIKEEADSEPNHRLKMLNHLLAEGIITSL
jgi:hypothetical protein